MHHSKYYSCKPWAEYRLLLFYGFWLLIGAVQAQCPYRVTTLSGSQQFGCTTVTVTSNGAVTDWYDPCTDAGPYWVGNFGGGSYTFSFSPPIASVTLDIEGLDNQMNGVEDVAIYINGAPYFIPDPGHPGCLGPAEVSPTGTLMAPFCFGWWDCNGSVDDLLIDHTITTITVEDRVFLGTPVGVSLSLYFCCAVCLTDAGELFSDTLNLCPGMQAAVPVASHTYIPAGDLLQYILFSDLNDTLGSIVATSNIPKFGFDPAFMQESVPYYMAAIVGDNLNGAVDLNSYCLDLSNAIPVTWWPSPTVSFSADGSGVCAGECTTLTANFTGLPPFALTYTTTASAPVTQTFSSETGAFQVCGPVGLSAGTIGIQATSLTDGHCTCH